MSVYHGPLSIRRTIRKDFTWLIFNAWLSIAMPMSEILFEDTFSSINAFEGKPSCITMSQRHTSSLLDSLSNLERDRSLLNHLCHCPRDWLISVSTWNMIQLRCCSPVRLPCSQRELGWSGEHLHHWFDCREDLIGPKSAWEEEFHFRECLCRTFTWLRISASLIDLTPSSPMAASSRFSAKSVLLNGQQLFWQATNWLGD